MLRGGIKVSIWQFIKDRISFIGLYFFSLFLTLLIIQLDLLQSNLYIHNENIFYIGILAGFILFLYLIASYVRQTGFFRQVNRIQKAKGLDRITGLNSAVTREQKMLQTLLHDLYRDYRGALNAFQDRAEERQTFINQWTHTMKTPVSVIHLLVQQGLQMEANTNVQLLFKSMEEEVERLTQGLEMVLYSARLEKIETDALFSQVDLIASIRQEINDNKKRMIRSAIFPKLVGETDSVYVETDPKWLSFLLKQITSNAIKYTPKDQNLPLVYDISKEGQAVTLCVKDRGIGIPSEDLPRVFDPFFTGENGRTGADSTGMGLYFAKEVCNRLGHGLWLTSHQDEGTHVYIKFQTDAIHRAVLDDKR